MNADHNETEERNIEICKDNNREKLCANVPL